ncbi:hypothetical protein [Desulfotalea psychrophila]|uniref:hypothetical protein n=1 Tax=Desulfotalea psychrophila TaxID=84980 RepID=UPI0002E2D82A|nr:hypothetical protein [Desulfotalea psychrophila]
MLKKIIIFTSALCIISSVLAASTLYWFVAINPGDAIRESNIKQILGKQSNVYYSDGTTRLGVFFDQTHRQYVQYVDIPQNFVNALVACRRQPFF